MTVSLFDEPQDQFLNRMRFNAAAVQLELLALALDKSLPPLSWTVSTGGLIARVDNSYGKRDDRAAFRAWVDALELYLMPDHNLTAKTVHRARREDMSTKDGRRRTVIVLLWDEWRDADGQALAAAS